MTLNEILKNTNYDTTLFSEDAQKYVEAAIIVKTVRGKKAPFILCLKRGKEIALKPEEGRLDIVSDRSFPADGF